RLVERIEPLRAELEPHRLAEDEILQQREIGAVLRRSADQAASRVAVNSAWHPVRRNERGGIEKRLVKRVAAGMIDPDRVARGPWRELRMLATGGPIERHVIAHGEG